MSVVDTLSEKPGIKNVKVSLKNKEVNVSYDIDDVTVDQIVTYIEDVGFTAYEKKEKKTPQEKKALQEKKTSQEKKTPAVSFVKEKKPEPVPQVNDAGDAKEQLSKCFLHITVCYASYLILYVHL